MGDMTYLLRKMDGMDTIHKFEKAGLGQAPFRVIRFGIMRGPIRQANPDGTVTEIGAPGQPMGSCHYCGTGIADCYTIRSSDGQEFIVGNVCVGKTGDKGLIDEAKRTARKLKLTQQHGRQDARIQAAVEALPSVRAYLGHTPHPNGHLADQGKTLADWAEFMLTRAGRAGGTKAARIVENAVKAGLCRICGEQPADSTDHPGVCAWESCEKEAKNA